MACDDMRRVWDAGVALGYLQWQRFSVSRKISCSGFSSILARGVSSDVCFAVAAGGDGVRFSLTFGTVLRPLFGV